MNDIAKRFENLSGAGKIIVALSVIMVAEFILRDGKSYAGGWLILFIAFVIVKELLLAIIGVIAPEWLKRRQSTVQTPVHPLVISKMAQTTKYILIDGKVYEEQPRTGLLRRYKPVDETTDS